MARIQNFYKPRTAAKAIKKQVYPEGEKVCTNCKISKPFSEYYRHAEMSFRFKHHCKECMRRQDRESRLAKLNK